MHENARKDAAAIQHYTPKGAEQSAELRKLAHTIPQAVQASGLSRSMLYLAIGRGKLRARKCGARTLILDSDLKKFLRSLPRFGNADAKREAVA